MFSKDIFIRNIEADTYRENFLISAIVSIFIIRIFLRIAHYPQFGHGDYHIAHMLWGGFFMLGAIILSLSFLSNAAANTASILGGIGFGTFIDELGKFITSNNDYFFQPSIALIYIIFVLVYLISRFIPRYREISQKEYLVNAIEMIKESAINDFDIEEEKRATEYLNKCDQSNPIVPALKKLLTRIDATPAPKPNMFTRGRILLREWYYKVARSGVILNGIIIFLAFDTLKTFFQSVTFFIVKPVLPFDEWGKLYSSSLAGFFIIIGLFALRFSKVEAYRFFRIAMLISILLTEFFAFMKSQWFELISLSANIFIFMIINYAMAMEKQKKMKLQGDDKNTPL
jgi:hypothetical protein